VATLDNTLLSKLEPGAERVKSSYVLARETGVAQRAIGFMVNRLRREGHLIGSIHGEGYYLIATEDELDSTIAHIEARKVGIDQTIEALEDAWESRS
jgi:biotin operon repressor